jgi:hypothetical protein
VNGEEPVGGNWLPCKFFVLGENPYRPSILEADPIFHPQERRLGKTALQFTVYRLPLTVDRSLFTVH